MISRRDIFGLAATLPFGAIAPVLRREVYQINRDLMDGLVTPNQVRAELGLTPLAIKEADLKLIAARRFSVEEILGELRARDRAMCPAVARSDRRAA